MKLFDVLNDFIAGKKIRNNDMSKNALIANKTIKTIKNHLMMF